MLQICLDLGWQLDWFDMLFCLIGQGYVEAGFVCVLCAHVCARAFLGFQRARLLHRHCCQQDTICAMQTVAVAVHVHCLSIL